MIIENSDFIENEGSTSNIMSDNTIDNNDINRNGGSRPRRVIRQPA